MKFTHLGHSTIAIAAPEGTIVIDPGGFTDVSCLDGAAAVLLTHAHADHLDVELVRASGLPVWGTQEAIDAVGSGTVVRSGETFDILGQEIRAIGGLHEVIHPDVPRPENVGYYIDGLLHPGDEYADCPWPVEVLLLPVAGPWVKGEHAVDYGRRIGARVTIPIHDAVLSEIGKNLTDNLFGTTLGVPGYRRLAAGGTLEF